MADILTIQCERVIRMEGESEAYDFKNENYEFKYNAIEDI